MLEMQVETQAELDLIGRLEKGCSLEGYSNDRD
jgi:hypothetical protein